MRLPFIVFVNGVRHCMCHVTEHKVSSCGFKIKSKATLLSQQPRNVIPFQIHDKTKKEKSTMSWDTSKAPRVQTFFEKIFILIELIFSAPGSAFNLKLIHLLLRRDTSWNHRTLCHKNRKVRQRLRGDNVVSMTWKRCSKTHCHVVYSSDKRRIPVKQVHDS